MGDFQDIFGAHVDAADYFDECAEDFDEDQPDAEDSAHLDEIIDHHIWFPDFVSAEIWEKSHAGTLYRRRPFQGGYEVILRDPRRESAKWARSGVQNPSKPSRLPRTVDVVRPFSLAGLKVSHGAFTLSLARNTSSLLIGFLDTMRECVPVGRAHLNPIIISLKDFYKEFKSLPGCFSYELGLGKGVFAVFSPDHKLVIGRLIKKNEIRIWPWILEMGCGGGKIWINGTSRCFLCDHYGLRHEGIQELTQSDWHLNADEMQHGRQHYIKNEHYNGDIKPKDLGRCVSDWLDLLSPFDGAMDADHLPPSDIIVELKKADVPDLDKICELIACAIAIRDKSEDMVTVTLKSSTELRSLKQAEHDTLEFTWSVSEPLLWNGRGMRLGKDFYDEIDDPRIPQISEVNIGSAELKWADLVSFHPKERSPHIDMDALHLDLGYSAGEEVASGKFCARYVTAEQRLEGERLLQALLDDKMPAAIKRCLERAREPISG